MQFKQYQKSMLVYRGNRKKTKNNDKYDIHLQNKSQNLKSIHRNLIQSNQINNNPTANNINAINNPNNLNVSHNKKQYTIPQRSSILFKNNNHHKSYRYNNNDSKKNLSYSSNKKQSHHTNQNNKNKEYNQYKNDKYESQSYGKKEHSIHNYNNNHSNESQYHPNNHRNDKQKSMNFYINIQKLKNLKISSRDKRIQQTYSSIKKSQHFSLDKGSLILRNKQIKSKIKNYHHNSSYQSIKHNQSHQLISKNRPSNPKSKLRYKTHQNGIQQDFENPYKSHASQYMIPKKGIFKRTNNIQLKDKSFIEGYLKGKQLGRGGFSKVWQGFHFKSKKFYAIKQIDTTNKYQTHLTEIWFGNHFFQYGGVPKKEYQKDAGISKLLQMYEYSIVDPKAFIVYENCDGSLGNLLYDIYEEDKQDEDIEEDQKLFMIKYKSLYNQLKKSTTFLKSLIKSMAQALDLLVSNKIVHSDIKTQNILLKKKQDNKLYDFKLIDYGSSFVFESLKQYKLATPQYMCPQLLNYILFQNKKLCHQYMLQYVKLYQNISAIDIWGLGCVVLQIIHGLPLWLNNQTRILINGKYQTKKGLFAVNDRSFTKILQKQLEIVNDFDRFIIMENNSGILLDQPIIKVLKGMLNPNPKQRMRPYEIIQRLS